MKKIYIRPMGGLGNQLFQYAVGFGLAKNISADLVIDNRFYENYNLHGGYRLANLNVKDNIVSDEEKKYFPEWECKLFTKFPQMTRFADNYIYDKVCDLNNVKADRVMLLGYWQNESIFHPYKTELISKFKPLNLNEEDIKLAEDIKKNNSVIVHIRRGDYVNNPIAFKNHGVCSLEYYKEAFKEIKKTNKDVLFYIFSDDIDWCRKNIIPLFSENDKYIFVCGRKQETDLWLMSCGKSHIIANSSFSWWGAFLAIHPEQKVIAPEPWFDIKQKYTRDPALDNWIRIKKY